MFQNPGKRTRGQCSKEERESHDCARHLRDLEQQRKARKLSDDLARRLLEVMSSVRSAYEEKVEKSVF